MINLPMIFKNWMEMHAYNLSQRMYATTSTEIVVTHHMTVRFNEMVNLRFVWNIS